VNITSTERLGGVAVGLAAIIAGIVLLTSAGSALTVVPELLLVGLGWISRSPGHWALSAVCQARLPAEVSAELAVTTRVIPPPDPRTHDAEGAPEAVSAGSAAPGGSPLRARPAGASAAEATSSQS
jgi:hypothetical protein